MPIGEEQPWNSSSISVLNGAVHGLLLFMVSAGLTLIFGMMGVLNFAHAWFYMIGAYIGFTCTRMIGFWPGLVVAPIIVGACGVLIERFMLRRVHKYGHAHELLLTFGLAFIIEEVIKLFYGDFPVNYAMPEYMEFAAFTLYEIDYPFYRLFMGGVAIVMFAVLYLLLTRTRVGIDRAGRNSTGRAWLRRWATTCQSSSWACSRSVPASPGSPAPLPARSSPPGPTWGSISGRWCSWWSWSAGSVRSRARCSLRC